MRPPPGHPLNVGRYPKGRPVKPKTIRIDLSHLPASTQLKLRAFAKATHQSISSVLTQALEESVRYLRRRTRVYENAGRSKKSAMRAAMRDFMKLKRFPRRGRKS